MVITCLDLEGVLVPEIWIAFADTVGIPELRRTTRDEPDYDKLMKYRIAILKEHGLGLKEIQDTIKKIDPLPGAKKFLDELRSCCQTIILSDTFEQFAAPLMEKLGMPTIFCNTLEDPDRGLDSKMTEPEILSKKIYGETAIPTGTYKLVIDYSNRFKKRMPHILNVPGYDGIRLHTGNTA